LELLDLDKLLQKPAALVAPEGVIKARAARVE
jgi:hypothetical protein